MSEGSVEIVREIYGRWEEGDFRSPVRHMDENVVFILPPDLPESGTYFGREALADYTRDFLAPWSKIMIEAEEVIPSGDSVLVAIRQHGEGDASGAETEFRYFHLWTFRAGTAIRLEAFRDRAEALAAAGLADG
jgi:ketosteroid isomerase-like protein